MKIVLSPKNIKRLLTDKLKRTANLNDKFYKCKIFKKCKKRTSSCKNGKSCKRKKKTVVKTKGKDLKSNNFFRGSNFLGQLLKT